MIVFTAAQRKALVGMVRQWGGDGAMFIDGIDDGRVLVKRVADGTVWLLDLAGNAVRVPA